MNGSQPLIDRDNRLKRRRELFLHRQDGRETRTLLTNISERGCELRSKEALEIGERVRIDVPGLGSLAAIIRWSADGKAGAEFIAQSDIWEVITTHVASVPFAGNPGRSGNRGSAPIVPVWMGK